MSHVHDERQPVDKTMKVIMAVIFGVAALAVAWSIFTASEPTKQDILFARIKNQQQARSAEVDPERHALLTKLSLTQKRLAEFEAANQVCKEHIEAKFKEEDDLKQRLAQREKEFFDLSQKYQNDMTGETGVVAAKNAAYAELRGMYDRAMAEGRVLQQRFEAFVKTTEDQLALIKADHVAQLKMWKDRGDKLSADNLRLRKELECLAPIKK